ncbi:hypothetical protein DQ04_02961080 [Trypanosoma grayi]|uniref:hypothetical protein n=1 Tax=Trypanosoma grayi TaxID=71804 RepID=UPI0004F46F6D|nr:hypothetical protein DQ04_02961080 [Trypanosoma grayi]KEG11121.1 hypothetical protein DQ04_02961080 [Trypanosoma grayi]
MPTGNRALVVAFVRAAALVPCPRLEKASSDVEESGGPPVPPPPVPPFTSATWLVALGESDRTLQEPTKWQDFARAHKTITAEARSLGFDALERGEVRRRAKLSLNNVAQTQQQLDHRACGYSNPTRTESETAAAILKEELEGCRAWAAVNAAASTPRHPISLITASVRAAAMENMLPSSACASAAADDDDDDVVVVGCSERIELLLLVFSVVSAMLNHRLPLRTALDALAPHTSETTLAICEQFLGENNIVLFNIAEALCSGMSTPASSLYTMQCVHAFVREKQTGRVQHLLGDEEGMVRSPPEEDLWGAALHTLNEAQLLEAKRQLQEELQKLLTAAARADQRSIATAQRFGSACDAHRITVTNSQAVRVHSGRRGKGSTAATTRVRKVITPVRCTDSGEANIVDALRESSGASARCGTTAATHRPEISSSCWQRSAIEVWRSRREAVLVALDRYQLLVSGDDQECQERAKTEAMPATAPSALLETLSCQLRAVISVDSDAAHILDALWRWTGSESNAASTGTHTALALELVLFLFATASTKSEGRGVLLELPGLLRRVLEVDTGKNAASSSLLRALPDSLSVFLIDTVFSALLRCNAHPTTADGRRIDNNHSLACVAGLLWELHSPHVLRHAVSMWRNRKSPPEQGVSDAGNSSSSSLFQQHANAVMLLLLVVAKRVGPEATVECSSPPMDLPFILAVCELLCNDVLALLKQIPVRAKKPLPRFINEALWNVLFPLATWALHHSECTRSECGMAAVRQLVELSHAVVGDLTLRWDYSVVPTRRLWRRMNKREMGLPYATDLVAAVEEEEYEADDTVACRVVRFASLLEGMLLTAAEVLPHLLPDSCAFSCMCNAVGVVLHDVDGRTGHQIMTHLLRLTPPEARMDVEAHIAVVRCLASMRHGCTLWEEAVWHYKCAVLTASDANAVVAASECHLRRPHVPTDLGTARVLRCVGGSPLPRGARCMLTIRLVAFARAAGVPFSAHSLAACLLNFTMRRNPPVRGFNGAPWCDALEWYDDVMSRCDEAAPPMQDLSCFHIACLQSLLAHGEWTEASLSLPMASISRLCEGKAALSLSDVTGRVSFLLALCAADRTQSCADAATALYQTLQNSLPAVGSPEVNPEQLLRLYRAAVAVPPMHRELEVRCRTPLFRHEAALIPRSVDERDGELALRLGICGISHHHHHHHDDHPCHGHYALVKKLETCVSCRLAGAADRTADALDIGPQQQEHQPHSRLRVRERSSRTLSIMRVVWSEEEYMKKTKGAEAGVMEEGVTRSLMDTRYANVMVPLQKLQRLRAAKRNGRRRRRGTTL